MYSYINQLTDKKFDTSTILYLYLYSWCVNYTIFDTPTIFYLLRYFNK